MENLDKTNVEEVLEKLDQKSRAARIFSLAVTGLTILIAVIVLFYLYNLIGEANRELVTLGKNKDQITRELDETSKELEEKKQQLADALKGWEKVKEIQDVTDQPISSREKVNKVDQIIKEAEKEEPTPAPPAKDPLENARVVFATTSNVNLRDSASLEGKVIGKLEKGQKMLLLGFSNNYDVWGGTRAKWAKVKTDDGITGWVFAPFVSEKPSG
ncbi:MAG: SH3 domain-containing protein [Pyrinomonadaceae bacterium]